MDPFRRLSLRADLLRQFILRNIELRHRGSHLGLIWSFLNPLLMLGLYVFVFGYVFDGSFRSIPNESKIDYALAILLGLAQFHFLTEIIGVAPTVVTSNSNFVKKVVFPLEILPAATVGASIFHLLITIVLLLLGVVVLGHGLTIQALWLPVLILPLILMGLGAAWLLSAIGVFVQDIAQITGFVNLSLMFASAIFYPAKDIPPAIWFFLRANPLIHTIELSRDTVLWNESPSLVYLGYTYLVGFISCYVGWWVFRRLRPAFADVL